MIENEYKYRINKVIDYIEKNIDQDFSLTELAAIANFSKFHFSRIFQGVTGETPFQLILRLRLERSAFLLKHSRDSISQIAYQCGFKSLPVFSKNFTSYFNQTATSFRKQKSNLNKANSTLDKNRKPPSLYVCDETKSIKWNVDIETNESIEVKELPDIPVVYVRHIGPYAGNEKLFETLFNRLFAWAAPRGLLEQSFQTAIVYHDDESTADVNKLRTSICITAQSDTLVDGDIGKMILESGKYVIARFNVKVEEFQHAWNWLFGQWFPSSGYQPDDKPCFELYPEEPKNDLFTVDICVPVRKSTPV
ncbi:MAG: AraC family transcriptional regulator [Bacteroidota bacterium]